MIDPRLISDDQLSESNLFNFTGTGDRSFARKSDFYIVKLHPKRMRALGIGRWAALVYRHPLATKTHWSEFPGRMRPSNISGYLVVHCRVTSMNGSEVQEAARTYAELEKLEFPGVCNPVTRTPAAKIALMKFIIEHEERISRYAQIDQTLRNALGIPFCFGNSQKDLDIFVYPLKKRDQLGNWVVRLFGRRYLYFRICSGDVPDIEKNIVRIPENSFQLLGMEEGGSIVVERALKSRLRSDGKIDYFYTAQQKVKAFHASKHALAERERNEASYPERYFPAKRYLYAPGEFRRHYRGRPFRPGSAEPDIPKMMADLDFRRGDVQDGGDDRRAEYNAPMTPLTAVAVRRGIWDIILKEFQSFGLALIIALMPVVLQLINVFNNQGTERNLLGVWTVTFLLPVVVILLMFWRIRSQIK